MKAKIYFTQSIKNKDRINKLIKASLDKVDEYFLLLKSIDVLVVNGYARMGATGNAYYDYTIMIVVDEKKAWNIIENEIISVLYHELHHLARINTVGYGKNLKESVITEGLAIAFEEQMGINVSYWKLDNKKFEKFYKTYKNETKTKKYNHDKWFFGTGSLPIHIGYKLGYKIVNDYLVKTGKKPSECYNIPANEIEKTTNQILS